MESSKTIQCPDCKGDGSSLALVDYADRSRSGMERVRCDACNGEGMVDDAFIQRQKRGDAFRAHRILNGITIRKAASILCVPLTTISAIESGVEELPRDAISALTRYQEAHK